MTHLFRKMNLPGVIIDPDDTSAKHDSVALREGRGSWRAGARRRFITSRRLENWLVSDWHHKRRHMGLADLPFEPVRCGLYYSLRAGGVWMAADWWLRYFEVDDSVTALRLEHLHQDIEQLLRPVLPAGAPASVDLALPRDNARPAPAESPRLEAADLVRIAAVNPLWNHWQRQLYANPDPVGT